MLEQIFCRFCRCRANHSFHGRFPKEKRDIRGEKGLESSGRMSFFGILRLRLSQRTAPNFA